MGWKEELQSLRKDVDEKVQTVQKDVDEKVQKVQTVQNDVLKEVEKIHRAQENAMVSRSYSSVFSSIRQNASADNQLSLIKLERWDDLRWKEMVQKVQVSFFRFQLVDF
jgi:hypothetical protein